jgi:hypothetical protein
MTAIPDPVRLDRFQTSMVTVLGGATGCQTAFAYGQGVYTDSFPGSFVNLTVDGPIFPATTGGRAFIIQPCASVAFVVNAAVTGQLVAVYVNEVPFRVQVTGADTVTTIRDALVAAIAADTGGEFTATAGVAGGAWTLTPTSFGSIWSARKLGSMTGTVTLEDELASVTQGTAQFTMTVETFSKARTPRAGAMALAVKATTALQMPIYAGTLRDYGVGIGTIGAPVDLSAIAGGNWETRFAFDVVCNLTFSVSSPVGQITTTELSTSVTNPALSSTIEATS